MSDFAQYLESYMKEKNITTAELAREMDTDRAVIYRYVKGTRVPAEEEMVLKMAEILRMTLREKEIFMEEYDRQVMGDYAVNNFRYVCNFFEKQRQIEPERTAKKSIWKINEKWEPSERILALDSREEIATCVSNLFRYVAQSEKEGAKIKLLMQPIYEDIQNYIFPIFNGTNVSVEQIICLEQNIARSYVNMEIFQKVLPLCFADFECEIRYYYDYSSQHINDMTWMPNVILIEDYVLQFNYDMTKGILVWDATYADVMCRQYHHMRKQTLALLKKSNDAVDVADIYGGLGWDGIFLFSEPCVGNCISEDILIDRLHDFPQKEEMIKGMRNILGEWKGKVFFTPKNARTHGHISYCTLSGIRKFMETGWIAEFPNGFYEPLEEETRLLVLERCIFMMEHKHIIYRILDEKIELSDQICIYMETEKSCVTLNKVENDSIIKVKIEEPGICHAFSDFVSYIEKKELVMNESDALQVLRRIYEEYDRKFRGGAESCR